MSILSNIADRLILYPSAQQIDASEKIRRTVEIPEGKAEVWESQFGSNSGKGQKLAVLKFTGNAGRAECVTNQPFNHLQSVSGTVWAVNQCGYGGSDGRASLGKFTTTSQAAYESMKRAFPDRPFFVCGNSIGCLSALWVAANLPVTGVFLRNGPPLRQMIAGRWVYNWWNLGLAQLIARSVPKELDCIANARDCSSPMLFVQSLADRVVPVEYQSMIFDAYAGPKKLFQIPGADHHEGVPESLAPKYLADIRWLADSATI